jgi:hypothetical protein
MAYVARRMVLSNYESRRVTTFHVMRDIMYVMTLSLCPGHHDDTIPSVSPSLLLERPHGFCLKKPILVLAEPGSSVDCNMNGWMSDGAAASWPLAGRQAPLGTVGRCHDRASNLS